MRTTPPTRFAQGAQVRLNESMCSFVISVDGNLAGISLAMLKLSGQNIKENNSLKDVTFCLNETY